MNEDSQWNNNREQNSTKNFTGRRHLVNKFNENKGSRYSPSASYNYNNNNNGQSRSQSPNAPHQKRRIERYKRDSGNSNEKIIKQNDIIIRLLKEIRDKISLLSKNEADGARKKEESMKTPQVADSAKEITPHAEAETVKENKIKTLETPEPTSKSDKEEEILEAVNNKKDDNNIESENKSLSQENSKRTSDENFIDNTREQNNQVNPKIIEKKASEKMKTNQEQMPASKKKKPINEPTLEIKESSKAKVKK